MKNNIKALFKSIIFNCNLEKVRGDKMYFTVGDESVVITIDKFHKKEKCETTPLSIDKITKGNFVLNWNICISEPTELPIYEYTLSTDFRDYSIDDLTLTEQEQISEYINKILKEYEEKRLETLITNALK